MQFMEQQKTNHYLLKVTIKIVFELWRVKQLAKHSSELWNILKKTEILTDNF